MLFSKDKDPAAKQKKRVGIRSALGIMLDPRVSSTVEPLRETTSVFINLLALIFVSQGMFPRNHPALNDVVGARLTLSGVLGTAWHNLTFSKQTVPQVLLFFAVIASLGFSVLAIAALALSLFIGKAHAGVAVPSTCGAGGYFSPCDSTQDIALGWINYIFNSQQMYNYLNQYGQVVPQSQVIQKALIAALAFYSDAILIVAAVILFYHLTSMVVETAHHGQVMGKRANQIWAPIRLVVAIGLLVPIAGGLNSGQFIVIRVAEWGSNMASQVWNVFVTQLANDSYTGRAANAPYARKTVYDTLMMEACACAYNFYTSGSCGTGGGTNSPNGSNGPPPINTSMPGIAGNMTVYAVPTLPDGSTKYVYDIDNGGEVLSDVGICGHYTFPPPPKTNDTISSTFQSTITQTSMNAFQTMQNNARQFVQTNMPAFIDPGVGGKGDQAIQASTGGFEKLVLSYQNDLQAGLQGNVDSDFSQEMMNIANTSSSQGWVSAGAWFNTIARTQSEMMDTSNLIPGTQAPELKQVSSKIMQQKVFKALGDFQYWLVNAQVSGTPGSGTTSQSNQLQLAAAGIAANNDTSPAHLMDRIFAFVDWVAQWDGVWRSLCEGATGVANVSGCIATAGNNITPQGGNFTLGVQFAGANPFAEIAFFGHANLKAAFDIFDSYLAFLAVTGAGQEGITAGGNGASVLMRIVPSLGAAAGGVTDVLVGLIGKSVGAAREGIGAVLGIITIVFFTSGIMLAFFLPLIPFFRFMFNVLTWVVSLLEAVIAVPLIALAHLNPEGEGLPGATGKAAYHFIFSIFLRPVLMVFGLIVGTIIFFIAASYMNMLYMQAVVGTGGLAHGHLMMSRFVYSFLYVFVLFMAANSAFHMIDWLPEHAAKWMGAQQMHWQKMGDPDQLQQPMTLISGYAGQQLVQGVGKLDGVGAFATREVLTGRTGGMKQWEGDAKDLTKKTIAPALTSEQQATVNTAIDNLGPGDLGLGGGGPPPATPSVTPAGPPAAPGNTSTQPPTTPSVTPHR